MIKLFSLLIRFGGTRQFIHLFVVFSFVDNLDLKFTAKNIVRSLVDEQERAVQKHGIQVFI